MAKSVRKIIWLQQLWNELGFRVLVPAKLLRDNQVALHISSNPLFHEWTNHIEIDRHFIHDVKRGDQLGDIFTKALNEQ